MSLNIIIHEECRYSKKEFSFIDKKEESDEEDHVIEDTRKENVYRTSIKNNLRWKQPNGVKIHALQKI